MYQNGLQNKVGTLILSSLLKDLEFSFPLNQPQKGHSGTLLS